MNTEPLARLIGLSLFFSKLDTMDMKLILRVMDMDFLVGMLRGIADDIEKVIWEEEDAKTKTADKLGVKDRSPSD